MATIQESGNNNSPSGANTLILGDTAIGTISSSGTSPDWDYFKVSIASGGVLKLDFSPPAGSPSNYFYFAVYDNSSLNASPLAAGFAGSATSLSLGLPGSGIHTYYIAVAPASSASPPGGQYALTVSSGSGSAGDYESESNDTLATASNLLLARNIKGQLARSLDVDYYHVAASSAGVLIVDFATPTRLASGTSFTVAVYDKDGNPLQTQTTGNTMTLSTVVGAAGDYYVRVTQASAGIYDGGNYSLTARNDSLAAMGATTFAGSTPLSATLNGSHDWYAVTLSAGTTYRFAVKGSASGGGDTLADPALTLSYANGATLESCDDLKVWSADLNRASTSADPQIAFTAPASGTYYLMVSGKGGTGSYTLSQATDAPADLVQALLELAGAPPDYPAHPNYRWNGGSPLGTAVTLSYSFLSSTADGVSGFVAMTQAQQDIVSYVLRDLYGSVANISFTENTSDPNAADIRFGTSNQSGVSSGVTYTLWHGDGSLSQADVFINNTDNSPTSLSATSTLTPGGYGYLTLIHEIGHALGLKHPGDYNSTGAQGAAPPYLPPAVDSRKFTAMSYLDNPAGAIYESTPALLDIAAVQYLYGVNAVGAGQAHSYRFSATASFTEALLGTTTANVTVQGGSGSGDTLDISNQPLPCRVFLQAGALSSIGVDSSGAAARDNVTIPFAATVLNVIDGPANDLIIGNALSNSFYGFSGNNTLDGGPGTDRLVLTATSADLNAATDAQLSNVETLQASTAAAAVILDLHRQSEAMTITGSAFSDAITGGSGADSFIGFSGADSLDGGGGSDILALSATSTDLNAAADGQLRNVQTLSASAATAALSLDLHRQSEAINVAGSAHGDSITASGGGGSITGGAGNDTIGGGAGSDVAVYAGNRASYTTTSASAGHVSIVDKLGSAGSDTLINIDNARYADGMQNLDIPWDARMISTVQLKSLTELYIAYFNRVPEAGGLDYWIKQFAAGQSLNQIGSAFYDAATSPDYASLTGYSATMSNTDFVTKIYQNVLGRSSPDQAGLDYWLAGLAPGGGQTRGSLVNTIIVAAHAYKTNADPALSRVADLLDNKASVGIYNAVTAAVDYLTPQEAITKGMAIAAVITATDTTQAIALIGLADLVPYVPYVA